MNTALWIGSRRILALWFPYLPCDRVFRQRQGRSWRSAKREQLPLAFSRLEGNTRRIAALNEPAERLPLKRGMGVADARAIHPALEVLEADAAADLRLLEGLADWCDRYTPLVALDGSDGLFLDITGCSHLFGGEQSMVADLVFRLVQQGFCACAGLASTPGAAWAAARFGGGRIIAPGEEEEFLAALPLASLRLDASVCASLESVGLRTIGAVLSAPRAPLTRRFGRGVVGRLDQALGLVEEAISPRFPPPPLSVERQLAEPILMAEGIEAMVRILVASVSRELERRQEGARTLQLTLFRVDGDIRRIGVQTSRPLRDPDLICWLFHERLLGLEEEIDAGCGFELLRLSVLAADRFDMLQGDLSGNLGACDTDFAMFADRVAARLGPQAIMRPVAIESHIPERAVRMMPFAKDEGQTLHALAPAGDRPIRLFSHAEPVDVSAVEVPEGPPQQFRWRRELHRVARAEGPERIAPEWWLHAAPNVDGEKEKGEQADAPKKAPDATRLTRDYFRVEDVEGRRFWLYREGLYGAATQPRWFMHGLLG